MLSTSLKGIGPGNIQGLNIDVLRTVNLTDRTREMLLLLISGIGNLLGGHAKKGETLVAT